MSADYDFLPASNGSGDAALMHIQSVRLTGATTIDVDTVSNVSAKFIGTYGDLLPSGLLNPATKCDFKGHVSGADLIIDAFEPGSVDAGNIAGQVVIIKPNTGWSNRVAAFIKNATGLGAPEAMTADTLVVSTGTTLPAGDIGNADIAAGAITNAKLNTTAGELGGAWQAYTPTVSLTGGGAQTNGNAVIAGRYTQIGKTVHYWIHYTIGTTTNFTGLTSVQFTVPVAAGAAFIGVQGNTYGNGEGNTVSGIMQLDTQIVNSTTALLIAWGVNGSFMQANNISGTVPGGWTTANSWGISGTYEAA